jgi:hypothetical protein
VPAPEGLQLTRRQHLLRLLQDNTDRHATLSCPAGHLLQRRSPSPSGAVKNGGTQGCQPGSMIVYTLTATAMAIEIPGDVVMPAPVGGVPQLRLPASGEARDEA